MLVSSIYLSQAGILLILTTWYIILATTRRNVPSTDLPSSPLLLVTAHPDDESMFFTPTILRFYESNSPIDLLCFSTGDHDGLGQTRRIELEKAAHYLGIRHLEVIHLPKLFPDDPHCQWPPEEIVSRVKDACSRWNSAGVVTFDHEGVSGHANHCALAVALIQARKQLLLPSVYCLKSVPVWRKYCSLLDTWSTLVVDVIQSWTRSSSSSPGEFVIFVPWSLIPKAYSAMLLHSSQLVWFRWLYVAFSVYMYKNILVPAVYFVCSPITISNGLYSVTDGLFLDSATNVYVKVIP